MLSGLLFISPLLLSWLGCFWLARELAARGHVDRDWRLSWVFASLGFGSLLVLIVELTSLAHVLNRPALACSWLLADLLLFRGALTLRNHRNKKISYEQGVPDCDHSHSASGSHAQSVCQENLKAGPGAQSIFALAWRQLAEWPAGAKLLLALAALLALVLFLVALFTPTTNVDSMGYHLARMMHWIQQGSVNHFPTDDLRQLEFGPWSSFLMTNLFLLWGDDQLLNLVQWFAMISSVILVTWLAERLSAFARKPSAPPDRFRMIAFACIFAVTLPIGIVESISTQNDYTTAFWVVCVFGVCFLLAESPANPWYVAAAGLASGLGVLTKATAYIFCAPLILAGGLWWLRRLLEVTGTDSEAQDMTDHSWGAGFKPFLRKRQVVVRMSLLFVGAFVLLNTGHMARNYALFGSPMGSHELLSLEKNARLTPVLAASNVIRNLGLHAASGIPWLSAQAYNAVLALHRIMGTDLNNPATTFELCRFVIPKSFAVFDSFASCPVHLLLAFVAAALALCKKCRENLRMLAYAALSFVGFLLFCLLLKWGLWHARMHLTWFLLLGPFVAVMLYERFPRRVMDICSALLLFYGGLTMVQNYSRPVFSSAFWSQPRETQYFTPDDDPGTRKALGPIVDTVIASGAQTVGLKASCFSFEYALWIMLKNRGYNGRVCRYYVENISAAIPSSIPKPEVIISVYDETPSVVANDYPHVQKFGPLKLLSIGKLAAVAQ